MKTFPAFILALGLALTGRAADHLLVEAESFTSPGGWSLDTQQVGAPLDVQVARQLCHAEGELAFLPRLARFQQFANAPQRRIIRL